MARAADSENRATNGLDVRRQRDLRTATTAKARLDEGLRQPAVRQIVRRRHQPDSFMQERSQRDLGIEVDERRVTTEVPVRDMRPLGSTELFARRAEQEDLLIVGRERDRPAQAARRKSRRAHRSPASG